MNKRALMILSITLFFVLILNSFVSAEENNSIEKAYDCLKNQTSTRTTLSFYDAVFGILALGDYPKLKDTIIANKHTTENCWPKNGCTLKDTALVALAYNKIGENTENIEKWFYTKNTSSSDLTWFLEIDIENREKATCKITAESSTSTITINDDMTISGTTGNCFTIGFGGYMLQINNRCLNKEFQVACDKDFITSILYQKNSGEGTIFVLPGVQSGSGSSNFDIKITENIDGWCFKKGSICDYEGTLWATLVLQELDQDISKFMPYLLALGEDNARFFPSAFLYMLDGGGEDQFNLIINSQEQGKFWQLGSYGKYYDTSLAMLALKGTGAEELKNTKTYLLEIQGNSGCWNNNNIKDTAFLLYSGWGGTISIIPGGTLTPCTSPNSCQSFLDCPSGNRQNSYDCSSYGVSKVCCSVPVTKETCTQLNGEICKDGYECDGKVELAFDGTCCMNECVESEEPTENECENNGGVCKSSCGANEDNKDYTCTDYEKVCCVEKEPASSSGGFPWWIILIILIILIVLAIIFREKLKLIWFKFKHKSGNKPSPPSNPFGARYPMSAGPAAKTNFMPFMHQGLKPINPQPQQKMPLKQQLKPKDKEMEDALKKLREMSKK